MSAPPPLRASGLSRGFGEDRALAEVDIAVAAGQVHAVVGRNGAGKTTLLRLLLGMLRPDTGHARVLGVDAVGAGPEVWRRVGHLVETPFAYPELTVRENLTAAGLLHGVARPHLRAAVEEAVASFALERWVDRRASHLSTGEGPGRPSGRCCTCSWWRSGRRC